MKPEVRQASRQEQFLEVIDRDEATRRFHEHLDLNPLPCERVALLHSLQRVLAENVVAEVDVTTFDRSNVDGFAVRAEDTNGAMEDEPRLLQLNDELLSPGVEPQLELQPGTATPIATGGMLPRGADAVVMIEHTELSSRDSHEALQVSRSVTPSQFVSFAGTDIARGETILRAGGPITSREIGVLAAIGRTHVDVVRKPVVGIISTGDEVITPGQPLGPGQVYDSNAAILSAAVQELGGEPKVLGISPDNEDRLRSMLAEARVCDVVVLSGGTSKGAGDLCYKVVRELTDPGIVAHGVALKPGKPICLAVSEGKPIVILPGFPTSAVFTFHEFVAPVIRCLAGRRAETRPTVQATLPMRINSERGRTEYALVGLVRPATSERSVKTADEVTRRVSEGLKVESLAHDSGYPTKSKRSLINPETELTAYPMGKGSGSVTTFSAADGFISIDQHTEFLEAGETVTVSLLSDSVRAADLVVIGSHCTGLDALLDGVAARGFTVKSMHVGSTGGLAAVARAECDIAGIHLLHEPTGKYNEPFLTANVELLTGYRRMQGMVFRRGDARFEGKSPQGAVESALHDQSCVMVNRNAGSGTRVLIDGLLKGTRPPGYSVQVKSHNAVAAAIIQGRADWGVAISNVAESYDLACIPLREEHYDFAIPKSRIDNPAVLAFRESLADPSVREALKADGFRVSLRDGGTI